MVYRTAYDTKGLYEYSVRMPPTWPSPTNTNATSTWNVTLNRQTTNQSLSVTTPIANTRKPIVNTPTQRNYQWGAVSSTAPAVAVAIWNAPSPARKSPKNPKGWVWSSSTWAVSSSSTTQVLKQNKQASWIWNTSFNTNTTASASGLYSPWHSGDMQSSVYTFGKKNSVSNSRHES